MADARGIEKRRAPTRAAWGIAMLVTGDHVRNSAITTQIVRAARTCFAREVLEDVFAAMTEAGVRVVPAHRSAHHGQGERQHGARARAAEDASGDRHRPSGVDHVVDEQHRAWRNYELRLADRAPHGREPLGRVGVHGGPHFAVPPGPVLLVDDVIDTGWTMTVAARILRRAGAGAVLPFALAAVG